MQNLILFFLSATDIEKISSVKRHSMRRMRPILGSVINIIIIIIENWIDNFIKHIVDSEMVKWRPHSAYY